MHPAITEAYRIWFMSAHIFTCAHFTVNLVCHVGKITIKVVVNLVYKVGKEGFGLICSHHL